MVMLDQMDAFDIVKWVFIVFAAGFIGFFGKYLGKAVISAFQKIGSDEQVVKEHHDTLA